MSEVTGRAEYPRLAQLARRLDAFHELLNLVNGLVLWVGMAIAVVDLLTVGQLTAHLGFLVWVWAVSQAVGVDAFLYHFSARGGDHIKAREWGQAAFTLAVVAALGFVCWQAGYVFNFLQVEQTSMQDAIRSLGWTDAQWLGIRAGISVAMVVLSGLTRYEKAPSEPVESEAEDESGIRTAAPMFQIQPASLTYTAASGPKPATERRRAPGESVEPRARLAWQPGMSVNELEAAAGISHASAMKYHAKFSAEQSEQSDAAL